MAAPRQMTANTLNALKGWPQPAAVDYHTEFASTITSTVLPGSVVHLDSDGKYALGVGNLKVMPLFMFNGSDDPDVINDGGDPATEKGVWVPINPTGQAMALVAVGAYELVSTNFVTGTYNPNDPLTSATSGATAGQLAVGTWWTDCVCGVVSRGVVDNGYGFDAVAFWPIFMPPNP
jgi:hypothetical protein